MEESPEKIPKLKIKTPLEIIKTWNYDNSYPFDSNGSIIIYDEKLHDLTSPQYFKQAGNRIKKYNIIKELRNEYQITQNAKVLSKKYHISQFSVKKNINMSEEEVEMVKERKNYKLRKTKMDNYKNIIYKMLKDSCHLYDIINYIVYKGYNNKIEDLKKYIYLIAKNNFPNLNSKEYYHNHIVDFVYPDEVIIISRKDLLKYLLTINQKIKDININKYLEIIEKRYPIAKEVKGVFSEYHSVIMGSNCNKIDEFISKYETSKLSSLCNGLKKDIAAVKNGISTPISSGFVEGNNNKFKLIKRIVYGKMNLVNL